MITAEDAASHVGDFRLHEFTLLEKLQLFERIAHDWAPHLGDGELRLLLWLARQTVSRGKRSGYYWLKQITHGIGRRGGGEWARGSGLADKSLRRAIAAARTRGVLHTEETKRGTVFAIVIDWNPETSKALDSNVVHLNLPRSSQRSAPLTSAPDPRAMDANDANEFGRQSGQIDWPPAVKMTGPPGQSDRLPRVTPTNQETNQGVDPDTTAARPVATLPPVRTRTRPNPATAARPVPEQTQNRPAPGNVEPSPRCAAPPPAMTLEAALDGVRTARVARLQALRLRLDANAYEGTWSAAFAEAHPGRACAAWTKKTAGMVKKAVARWPAASLGNVHDFLAWTVTNWDAVRLTKLARLKTPSPTQPDAEFLARFIGAFQEAWADKEELRWRGTLPGTRRAVIELMRREGLTEDVAIARVVARQTSDAEREKLEEIAARAKRDRDAAFLAHAQSQRATRFTAANPHPRSHENVRPPVNMVEGEPDWSNLPPVFFDESKL